LFFAKQNMLSFLASGGMSLIKGLVLLLACQLAGEVVSHGLGLPVPGPVLGLVLLFAGLVAVGRDARMEGGTGRVADGLLQNLALLFVPAGVGVIKHLDLLASHGVALALALIGSTAVTLVVTVFVFVGLSGVGADDGEAVR
jgi:putative effector of murein hydrolase LrgA (UPF0299 family)